MASEASRVGRRRLGRLGGLILVLVLGVMAGGGQANAAWSNCAGEGGDCRMSGAGRHLVRFGAQGKYFFLETDGAVASVPCNTGVFGEPAKEQKKSCDYAPLGPLDPDLAWLDCGDEGQTCQVPADGPHLVRYATPTHKVYRVATGPIPCDNGYFFDPQPGAKKKCAYVTTPYGATLKDDGTVVRTIRFEDCASEGRDCATASQVEATIYRYGDGDRWDYRLGAASSIACNNETFGRDADAGHVKYCQTATLPPRITQINGNWTKVASCTNCDSLTESVAVGIEGSRAKTTSSEWSTSVSVEVGFEVETLTKTKYTGKMTTTTGWGGSESVETALNRSVTTTKQATCHADANRRVVMWQWSLGVSDECYAIDGQCVSEVRAFDVLCQTTDVPRDFLPACPSGTPSATDPSNCIGQ